MIKFEKKKLWKDQVLNLMPIILFFYVSLIQVLPRSTYKEAQKNNPNTFSKKSPRINYEEATHEKIKKKIVLDTKRHKLQNNWNKENAISILTNDEGKIIGYKYVQLFCPNYYSKKQSNKIVKQSDLIRLKTINAYLLKIKYQ